MWRRASTSSLSYAETWQNIVELGKGLASQNVGGAMMGQGVRSIHPPRGSVGVLVMWKAGAAEYTCHEHSNDNPITFKKITAKALDDLAFIYVYYYLRTDYEPGKDMKILPSEGSADDHQPADPDRNAAEQPMDDDALSSPSAPRSMDISPSSAASMDIEETDSELKRKGPDSRTIVIGPESKRTKLDAVFDVIGREQIHDLGQHNLLQVYWASRHRQIIPLDFPMSWLERDNLSMMALWDEHMGRCLCSRNNSIIDDVKLDFYVNRWENLFTWPGKVNTNLYADLATGHVYKVDDETEWIQEGEVYDIWPEVEQSDAAEVSQFVETKCDKVLDRCVYRVCASAKQPC